MSDLAAALQVAIRVHAGQVDKQGEPYLLHVLRVVEAVSPQAKVVAALHDVIEDGEPGLDELNRELGLSETEFDALILLSRTSTITYARYIEDFSNETMPAIPSALAREVKLADLHDNLGRIPIRPSGPKRTLREQVEWDAEWGPLKRRYEKAIATLEATERTRP